jgi:tRNA (adenine37-N6)-methyltransferase
MQVDPMSPDGTIHIHPIGMVRAAITEQQTGGFEAAESTLELKPEFAEFLVGLQDYSHLKVIYWLSEMTESHGLHRPQSNPDVPIVGMFACR